MRSRKSAAIEEVQAISDYERCRTALLSDEYSACLEKNLAYWAIPADRRLPLAFLGRPLRDLLKSSYADLARTPGIGRTKMQSLVKLLARAADSDPSNLPSADQPNAASISSLPAASCEIDEFDPESVSEMTWAQWQETVVKHDLGEETVGRLVESLQRVTRVIWNAPLSKFLGCTLADITRMRTYGEKRVRAVLEAFSAAHRLVGNADPNSNLTVRIMPRRIDHAERWLGRSLQKRGVPSEQELFDEFILPMLDQIRIDCSHQIVLLAENRLGLASPIVSVRQTARQMGLTRARVYQLLNEINDVMSVRWPLGRHQAYELRDKFVDEGAEVHSDPRFRQFVAAVELFYPGNRRGADGAIDRVDEEDEMQDRAEAFAEAV